MNNTLVNGMQVLEHLATRGGEAGIAEIADALNMNRSMVHRLLQGWVELGYVAKSPSSAYRATLKLWEYGVCVVNRMSVKAAATPVMAELLELTLETVHLQILDGDEVVYIEKLDSREPVRAYSVVGGRAPAACVATGKVMLAWAEKTYVDSLCKRLERHTDTTITDPQEFRDELERIRKQGYAVNRGEWRAEVWGLAAPIFNVSRQVVAAIGISGPSSRLRPARIKELSKIVVTAGLRVSNTLATG